MYVDLKKPEKKIARQIIEKGLQKEYVKAIEKLESIIGKWKNNETDNRETYMNLYTTLMKCDKHIARRYNDVGGSKYAFTIACQLADGVISKGDLDGFCDETKEIILKMSGIED